MDDHKITRAPAALEAILHDTQQLGFKMGSEPQTGALLRTLAATKPGGRFLELGTGTGIGTAWLLSGMDDNSRLDSVEIDSNVSDIARRHLGKDPRVTFHSADGIAFLKKIPDPRYDLVYADTWPGKFTHLELALSLVRVGGIYFIDDLLPQPIEDSHADRRTRKAAGLRRDPAGVVVGDHGSGADQDLRYGAHALPCACVCNIFLP
jgi:predicted O-methyltransferase YrrM